MKRFLLAVVCAAQLPIAAFGQAQQPAPVVSPEVSADRKITFRLSAPKAQSVRVTGGDMLTINTQGAAVRNAEGVWEATVGPVDAGAYRYRFLVDGVGVLDPRNSKVSESNDDAWSLVVVPGSDKFDTRNVPHGAVAAVTYYSKSLGRHRRMHIYTPPGYERGGGRYPVFYLLHGSSDSDASWSTVGRAGFILDNLIAGKKAKPMIVVMPHGHTTSMARRGPNSSGEFEKDFREDLVPYVEKNYRVSTKRADRAIAGLSMGGSQTMSIAFANLDRYAYVGMFSSGVVGPPRTGAAPPGPGFEEKNKAALDNAALKKGLKLLWIACGKEDFALQRSNQTVEMLRKHGFTVVVKDSERGHVWLNWRDYLAEFAPMLFR